MTPGSVRRSLETVRHLSTEQWVFRFVCRGQRVWRKAFPKFTQRALERAADALPLPDIDRPQLGVVTAISEQLQTAIHGDFVDGIHLGHFTFLNRMIDFGAIDRIQWRRDLGEKNNPLWRMNLAYFGWAIPLLADGGEAELALVASAVESLEAQNHFGVSGVFRDVWNAYTVSHRLINLLTALVAYRRRHGGQLDAAARTILHHTRFCAAFVRATLERDLQYNHLLKNYVALAVYGSALEKLPTRFRFLETAVGRALDQQILPDGGHAERSPMYHLLSLLDVRMVQRSLLFASWNSLSVTVIPRMEDALRVMSHPDGDVALFNDSWLGEAPPTRAVLELPAPVAPRTCLPLTGYTQLRSSGEAILFDHGACGPDSNPGHAHADFLSIELSVDDSRLIVDPGVPTYSAGALRDESRSASLHNGPAIVGHEPIDFWSSFRVGRRGTAGLCDLPELADCAPLSVCGWQNGYAQQGVQVGRWIGLWPGSGALVIDAWRGEAQKPFTHWLVGPEWQLDDEAIFRRRHLAITTTPILGTRTAATGAICWQRFGRAEECFAFRSHPVSVRQGYLAASWFGWGKQQPQSAEFAERIGTRLCETLAMGTGVR